MEEKRQRIRLLDILRGFAILGTLGTNIWIFANLGDLAYVFTMDHAEWWSSVDDLIRLVVLFLVNGKLLGLLTIMFGVGLEFKYRQSLRKGTAWPGIYLWISFILLLEGFLHFTLVMEYDILMSYAITAMFVSFIVKAGDKAIKRTMIIIGTFHALIISWIFFVDVYFGFSGANFSLGGMEETVLLYQEGTWLEQVGYRLNNFLLLRSEAIFVIPMNIFLFLTGVQLLRSGALSPDERGRNIRRKMMKIGLFLGVPLNLLIFIPGGYFDFPVRYLFAPLLSIGYISFVAFLVEKSPRFWLWTRLEDIGRMALSCYVMQNILSSLLFYGWGLGWGGNVSSLTTVAIWGLISLIQIGFAAVWLRKFQLGPMESARKYLSRVPVGRAGS